MDSKTLVVLGAGFGGLSAAKTLAKKSRGQNRIILIDRRPNQTFTPTLPELEINEIEIKPIAEKFGFEFQVNEVLGLDIKSKTIRLADRNLSCDGLILALGAETEYFGIPGLRENSAVLKSGWDAQKIMEKISGLKNPKIVIAGAGPTGTELAGTLAKKTKVTLIEKSGSVLPGFSEKLRTTVKNKLLKRGVEIIYNCGVLEAKPDSVILENIGEQKFDLLIWSGGTKGPSAYSDSGLDLDSRGRALIDGYLKAASGVFAIGDAAAPRAGKCPAGARSAIMQGRLAAKNLLAEFNNQPLKNYTCRNYPYFLPLGRYWAIAQIGNAVFSGLAISLFKKFINWQYLKIEINR